MEMVPFKKQNVSIKNSKIILILTLLAFFKPIVTSFISEKLNQNINKLNFYETNIVYILYINIIL